MQFSQTASLTGKSQENMHLKHGSVLQGGKYKIEKLLGQGGFGITYLAVQTGLNRKVAIKEFFMKEHCNRDAGTFHVSVPSVGSRELVAKFRTKFLKEAGTIAALDNPYVVRIHDVFEENGTAYYVMEYLGDDNLAKRISASGMPHEEAVVYVRQIAEALSYIHSLNILHLDVKPSNVLFRHGTEVVIIDFGISKHYDGADGIQTSTSAGCVSEGYSPMEQYEADGVSSFTAATDIYSLGATLYHLLCGRRPAKASVVLNEGLDFPESVPQAYRDFIKKSMQPRRKDRPQSMTEFLDLLDEAYMHASKESSSGEVVDDGQTQIYSDNQQQQGDSSVNDENNHDTGNETIVQVDDKPEMQEQKPQKKSRRWLWWLLAAVILVGVGVFVLVNGSDSDADERQNAAQQSELAELNSKKNAAVSTGTYNDHEWVDLGLPSGLKWATCNVGASTPGDYGNYYAWGETTTKSNYDYDNSASYGKSWSDIGGNSSRDAARANWGGSWRMPTKSEFQELKGNCTWTWTTQNGKNGFKVTGPNGNSIFLPAAGDRRGGTLYDDGERGYYCSCTPVESDSHYAYALYFGGVYRGVNWFSRDYGRSVRPVLED